MAGGAPIVVQGSLMAGAPADNDVIFDSLNLAGV